MMESSYGIGVKNRYAVFLGEEEEDPLEIISKKGNTDTEKPKGGQSAVSGAIKTNLKTDPKSANTSIPSQKDNANKLKQTQPLTGSFTPSKGTINGQKTTPSNTTKPIAGKRKDSDRKGPDVAKKDNNKIQGEGNRFNRPPRTERQFKNSTFGDRPNHMPNDAERPPRPERDRITDQKEIEERKNRKNREERPNDRPNSEFRDRTDRGDGERRGRGRGIGRGRGRGRGGFDTRGKREYDRQSGSDKSGVKSMDKREGGGAHNWGNVITDSNEFDAETHEMADRSGDENTHEMTDPNHDAETAVEGDDAKDEVIEEAKEMTLEEWKKEQTEKRVEPKFNLRKPGEGEDGSQWKQSFVLKKKIEDEEEVEYEEIEVEDKRGRKKELLDIQINFRDEGREFSRRGRGGRGRGERGGNRGDRSDGRGGGGRGRGERGDRDRQFGDSERRENRGGDRERPSGDSERRMDRDDRGERRERGEKGSFRGGRGAYRTKEQAAPKVDDWNDFPSLAAA